MEEHHDAAHVQYGNLNLKFTGNLLLLIVVNIIIGAVIVGAILSVSWQLTEYKVSLEARLSVMVQTLTKIRRVQAEFDRDFDKVFLLFAGQHQPRIPTPYSPE